MTEQTGSTRVADQTDPTVRHRRLEALQKAHRARETLAHEAALARRYRIEVAGADAPDRRTLPSAAFEADAQRLVEIHRSLQHERRASRRPFHRHADRLVLALELAERLALDRLGFDDYADFESHGTEVPIGRHIIDIDHIEQAARDLADAEAVLTELDLAARPDGGARADLDGLPSADDLYRRPRRLRPTQWRQALLDRPEGRFDDMPEDLSDDELDDMLAADLPASVDEGPDVATITPLPLRRREPTVPADPTVPARPDGSTSVRAGDEVLGEIVVGRRTIRVDKAPGLAYAEDEGAGSGLGPDSISYGDPRRLI